MGLTGDELLEKLMGLTKDQLYSDVVVSNRVPDDFIGISDIRIDNETGQIELIKE
ncbi:hypothetical protein [Priestia megaterium]|uniref:hypothetical protein n=1 Tax=Priestia megaterium TaxID=1404 RepID=UPI0015D4F567|nr:hypothetical protein [Priestia megaterium]